LENFDIVIVGAGSAGCIITNQIIKNTNYRVLLIEAGSRDNNPVIQVPLGYGMTFYHKKMNWNFYSETQDNLLNREIYFPRGKVLGGSGSINAMIYARGLRSDFENWDLSENWSWENIKTTYDQIEFEVNENTKILPSNKIPVNDISKQHHQILKNFFDASKDFDFTYNKQLKSSTENQVGHYNVNIFKGFRASSSKVFLKPIKDQSNLTILTKTEVLKLNYENKKIIGLKIRYKNKIITVKPKIGTILSSGSIMTPYLLLKSGIGNAKDLEGYNIPLNLHSPHVGKNFQDHLGLDYLYKTFKPTLNKDLGTWRGRIKSTLRYFYNRSGPLSLSLNQGGGYINWNSLNPYPNIQLYFNPLTYSVSYKNRRPLLNTDKFNGFIIGFNSCRPKSLGEVKLKLFKDDYLPSINPNYLSDERDIHDLYATFDFIRKFSINKNISDIIKSPVNIDPIKATDQELLDHFKSNATTIYHPCGTCRMSKDISTGVVSDKLKVHGLDNLWIVDASIMPNITSGNINAPVMMLSHLSSKIILEELKRQYQ
jgi:choline dehydrogenase